MSEGVFCYGGFPVGLLCGVGRYTHWRVGRYDNYAIAVVDTSDKYVH
jgi:hypothetical protein